MKELESVQEMTRRRYPGWLFPMLAVLLVLGFATAHAMPMSPTDESKVPHYFGPYPNWVTSPLTLPNVAVEITGDGTGATATATVGAKGAVTGITITNPGSGYTTAGVTITGAGTGAAAVAVLGSGGVVTAVTLDYQGYGYTTPTVTLNGGGATTPATAIATGGVDVWVILANGGSGYASPTVVFGLPDLPGGVQATGHADVVSGAIAAIVVDNPGSGYTSAPAVTISDSAGSGAIAETTLALQSIEVTSGGVGYTSAPTVDIADTPPGLGFGATATAEIGVGAIAEITVTNPGSGYLTEGIKKFVDPLPGLCLPPGCPTTGKYIPLAVPEVKKYNGVEADEYVIGVVQYRTSFSSSLPPTLIRGYVQLETPANAGISQHFPLKNELLDGTLVDTGWLAVTPPQYLGPTIVSTKDKPVRIVFHNLLPTGADGDLFLPTDSSLMGSGMGPMDMAPPMDEGTVMDMIRNPMCSEYPKPDSCFPDNRATLHLHGGVSPWISDGTPHQWITPAGEMTMWPQGVSVVNVPDMDVCGPADDGCQTFYYTNQQSARLMFYHDHSWGITRLNVYAGEAAGYLITDDTEKKLVASGAIPADQIPLIIQDKTFIPDAAQLAAQDPTWDTARWGGKGSLWQHHVYMPAQNPGDPGGMSAYGRWMYGPWFWPPAADTMYGPIANPYYNMDPATNFTTPLLVPCNLDDPTTWQYQTDPFCEPAQIPGTPNISVGMEQFNDTPLVNGIAYPTVTLEPKSYRLRILSAANDRFFNLQWYVADPRTGTNSEVALNPAELAAAQTDLNVSPTPDLSWSPGGPDWIQIGTEGGFLPAPVVVDGQQVTTWITDPTRFDVGNVDQHSLLLAPAERADVIVDFSKFRGKTLILYNDAPAAFPARVPSYDYYTGYPDQSPNGPASILPGYGPNTRTIMQVKIGIGAPAPAFNLTKLQDAFKHAADGSGVFEDGQHPIIVGQAAYNSAYGTNFAASSNCNAPGSTLTRCDGLVRVSDTLDFGFNTLAAPDVKMTLPLEPKAIHDEMNATTFDEFGRMQANLGIEAQPPTPGLQNVTLYPYVNPATELIDATNLPKAVVLYDTNGLPVSDIKIAPISTTDGSQIWRITHNGVDTHPIHFHLYDVQVVNRVTWDNIIIPTDPTELGWKDTVRISPLEDTIVALRPIIPMVPFEVPNSVRNLNPMMPAGSTAMFNNVDVQGNPTANIINQLANFGWEYVYHCHILSHEEMDMMRPVSVVLPPNKPDGLVASFTGSGGNRRIVITWNDNSITETAFLLQRTTNGTTWTTVGTSPSPLNLANTHGVRSLTDTTSNATTAYSYRVVAQNTVGYGSGFPAMTASSVSTALGVNPPAAPTTLAATLQAGPQVSLTWRDNATTETGFVIERSTNGVDFSQIATAPARNNTGNVTYNDATILPGFTYTYRVAAVNVAGTSAYSNLAAVPVPAMPAAPSNLTAVNGPNGGGNSRSVTLSWTDNSSNETGFTIQRATNAAFTTGLTTVTVGANVATLTQTGLSRNTAYYYRVRANNGTIIFTAWVNATPFPITTNP